MARCEKLLTRLTCPWHLLSVLEYGYCVEAEGGLGAMYLPVERGAGMALFDGVHRSYPAVAEAIDNLRLPPSASKHTGEMGSSTELNVGGMWSAVVRGGVQRWDDAQQ